MTLEGWLCLDDNSGGFIKKWKNRWCVVRDDQLFYWKSPPPSRSFGKTYPPLGQVTLRGVKTVGKIDFLCIVLNFC